MKIRPITTNPQTLTARVIVLEHILRRTTRAKLAFALCYRMQHQWRTVQSAMTDPKDIHIYQQLIDACQYVMDRAKGAQGEA